MKEKLEWSFSALNTLRKCNRMYYFQYIAASHHFTIPLRRKAHELKKSKSLLMWRGSVIDKIMEDEIISRIGDKMPVDYEVMAEAAVELAKRQFSFSENRLYKIKENSENKIGEDYCILDVHESNVSYQAEDLLKVYASIKEIISGIPKIVMPDGKLLINYLEEASFIAPNVRKWNFEFENLKISPQIDLFMIVGSQAVLLDWKVSESVVSDYSRQLIIEGITVFDTYRKKAAAGKAKRFSFSDIRLFEVNLLKQVVKEHLFTKKIADECIDYIYLNSQDIQLLTEGKTFNQLEIDDFPITDKEETCLFCKYRSLCTDLIKNNNQYNETTFNNSFSAQQSKQTEIFFPINANRVIGN